MDKLTEEEMEVIRMLDAARYAFRQLPAVRYSNDLSDFESGVQTAKRVILAWAGRRQIERLEDKSCN